MGSLAFELALCHRCAPSVPIGQRKLEENRRNLCRGEDTHRILTGSPTELAWSIERQTAASDRRLNAWSKSDHKDAGWYAEEILEDLLRISDSRRLAKEYRRNEKIGFFKVVKMTMENEVLHIHPNVISINTVVINTLSRRRKGEGMARGIVWLDYLLDDKRNSNFSNSICRPNFITFSTIIHGWAKNGSKDSGQKV